MLKIDAHQHFWKFDEVRDSWITPDMEVIRRDFMPEDLLPLLQENGIAGCVAVQADQSPAETRFLLDLAEKHSFIKGVVGWIDLFAADLEAQLAAYQAYPVLKGFRHIVQAEAPGFMLQAGFLRGVQSLSRYGYSYDILIHSSQIQEAATFAERCSGQALVLDHIGKPNIAKAEISDWKAGLERLAELPNVYCKVSGLVTEADHKHWSAEDIYPYLDAVFECFGTSRLMFGSDWPVCNLAGGYSAVYTLVNNYIAGLSPDEQRMIWSDNACQFYKLNSD